MHKNTSLCFNPPVHRDEHEPSLHGWILWPQLVVEGPTSRGVSASFPFLPGLHNSSSSDLLPVALVGPNGSKPSVYFPFQCCVCEEQRIVHEPE